MSTAIEVFEFEGASVRAFMFRGRPCWIAQEVGAALGYTRDGFAAALRNWSDELIDGRDFQVLRGAELREFKALAGAPVNLTGAKITQLTLLFESGIDVVCLKTEKPLGKKLRRFMADELMPRLRRGSLDPSMTERELINLSLRLNASNAETIWEVEAVQQICRLYRKPIWDGVSRMEPWLREPMGKIYKIVLGDAVYAELKRRNPDPHDGSLNYQFLTEARHRLMQRDMGTVSAFLRITRTREEFFSKLSHAYGRGPLQLAWGA